MASCRTGRFTAHLMAFALIFGLMAGVAPTVVAQSSQPDASATVLEWIATGEDGAMVTLDGSNSSPDFTEFAWWADCALFPCEGGTRLTDDGPSSTAQVLLGVGSHTITLVGRSDSTDWTAAPPIVVTVLPLDAPTETATPEEPTAEPETATETATAEEPATDDDTISLAEIPACTGYTQVLTTDLSAWNLTETRLTGHNELVSGGLHVWTEGATSEDKAAGYYATDFPLAEAGVPGIEFASFTGGRPSLQLRLDINGDGGWEGTLVYEPWAYGEGNFWSTYDFGVDPGLGYDSFGTLDDYLTANPTARVVQIGYSLGSGVLGDAVISKLTAGCVEYTFDVPPACPTYDQVHTTDLGAWDLNDTRATGHNELVAGGLHVWTEGNGTTDKAAGYYATNFPLTAAGEPGIEFASFTGGRPSLQLRLDINGDGGWEGTLVYEPWAYGEGNFWSTFDFGVGPGLGYPSFGTLDDYIAANPTAQVVQIGYSLGSGLLGDAVITSLTAGCVVYTFDVPPPRPRIFIDPNPVFPGQIASVSLTNFDPNDSVRIRWRVGSSWIQVGTVSTDATGAGSTTVTVPSNAAIGANSVRGDGATLAQQTNAVMVEAQGETAVELSTDRTTVNNLVGFEATNFAPNSTIEITWRRPGGSTVNLGTVTSDALGNADGVIRVPASEGGDRNSVTFTDGTSSVTLPFEIAPRIKVIPDTVSPGETVNVSLRGYAQRESVRIRWQVNGVWVQLATVTTSNTGSANVNVVVPEDVSMGQNSVRGDGTVFRQQTNAVTVEP